MVAGLRLLRHLRAEQHRTISKQWPAVCSWNHPAASPTPASPAHCCTIRTAAWRAAQQQQQQQLHHVLHMLPQSQSATHQFLIPQQLSRHRPVHQLLVTCRASASSARPGSGPDEYSNSSSTSNTGSTSNAGKSDNPASSSNSSAEATSSTPARVTNSTESQERPLLSGVLQFARAQVLPLLLLTALTVGYIQPEWGTAAAATPLQTISTTFVFILAGLSLKRGEAMQALRATGCVMYGLATILLITPAAAFLAVSLPLQPAGLALGLAVFCTMPTTLSTGISMTQTAGGNVALALLLTVTSNLLSIVTLPITLPLLLGVGTGLQLDPWALLAQLLRTVLLPTIVGAVMRSSIPGLAKLVDNNRQAYTYLTACCLAVVPWMQVSKAISQQVELSALSVASTAVAGVVMHLVFLAFNTGAVKALGLGGPDPAIARKAKIALVLVGSGKTLPVAIAMLSSLSGTLGDAVVGPAAIACVLAHLGQILTDSVLVSRWMAEQKKQETKEGKGE